MERLIDDLTRLHTDLIHGGDGWTFDIAGLAEEAVEAIEQLLKDIDIKLKALDKAEEELADYRQKQAEGRLVELPCKVGDTVWVTPNNGKSFHTGSLYGRNERGAYIVLVKDKEQDLVKYPVPRYFYDWFAQIYTREEAEKALESEGK